MRRPLLLVLALLAACAAAPAPSRDPSAPPGSASPAPPASPPALDPLASPDAAPPAAPLAPLADLDGGAGDGGTGDSGAGPAASGAEPGASPGGPSACPAGMALIDGDYCTRLELKCLRSTYAKQNKKTICHEFQEPSRCVGERVARRYCIDRYEYPNRKGERPLVMKNFVEARQICGAEGKRICNETEWTQACEGPSFKPYPYGYKREPATCRGDRPYRFPTLMANRMLLTHSPDKSKAAAELARLWDAVESGSQPGCVSDYGVYDMPGNADELAASESPSSPYENVTTGGPWLEGVRNQCRPKIYTHNEGFSYYYLSFRCCAEADGKPTDPRTPRQRKGGKRGAAPGT